MPILSVELSEALHASVAELVPGRYASVDWFVERTLLDKVGAVRTEEAAPPRLKATAHRISGAIVLTADLHVRLVSPDGAVSVHELYFKDTIRTIPDGDSETVLGNGVLKMLAGSTRDTSAFGADAVDAGRALLLRAVGARSERALWKASERVGVELESATDILGETAPSRVTLSPFVKPSQDNWLRTTSIPELVMNAVQPKQVGQALRRSFVFCDMDP
jgi:hypothetical protein